MSATMTTTIADVARQWEAACRAADHDRIVGLLSDDAVIWFNTEQVEHGRVRYREILEASAASFRDPTYRDMRVLLHETGFVEQAILVGDTDQGRIATPFCLFATVTDGRITRLDEYFDTAVTTPA